MPVCVVCLLLLLFFLLPCLQWQHCLSFSSQRNCWKVNLQITNSTGNAEKEKYSNSFWHFHFSVQKMDKVFLSHTWKVHTKFAMKYCEIRMKILPLFFIRHLTLFHFSLATLASAFLNISQMFHAKTFFLFYIYWNSEHCAKCMYYKLQIFEIFSCSRQCKAEVFICVIPTFL